MPNNRRTFDPSAFLMSLQVSDLLSESDLRRVTLAAQETGTSVEKVILELGLLDETSVYRALADHLDAPFLTAAEVDEALVRSGLLQTAFMKRAMTIPAARDKNGYMIATADPNYQDLLASVSYLLETPVSLGISSPSMISSILERLDQKEQTNTQSAASSDVEKLQALANDGPIITLVNGIISRAVSLGASDVHIEAQDNGARVRYRIDGALQFDRLIPDEQRSSVVSRLKIMANLNISERRHPQDGRADLVVRGRSIDIRMSTLPTQYGESIVLRLLDQSRMELDWDTLKFPPDRVTEIENLMACPNGIFLVAGPTGSGKTTTLYTALRGINSDDRKVVTVEDPIEYSLEGVNQVQVDAEIDMTFAKALRAILRQDPNIIMVGEIRDEETAEIAVRAALVGRLVLSTIHTNDAISAVDRLFDLGVKPYLVGATLRGVLSQRLVRTLCADCLGTGCKSCGDGGHKGRMAISELLTVSTEIADAIAQGVRGADLLALSMANGFTPIEDQVEHLVQSGRVSRDEVIRAIGLV